MPGEGGGIELPELLELTEESLRLRNEEPMLIPLTVLVGVRGGSGDEVAMAMSSLMVIGGGEYSVAAGVLALAGALPSHESQYSSNLD